MPREAHVVNTGKAVLLQRLCFFLAPAASEMTRLRQFSEELLRRAAIQYAQANIGNLKDTDIAEYKRRRRCIEELRKELETAGSGSQAHCSDEIA